MIKYFIFIFLGLPFVSYSQQKEVLNKKYFNDGTVQHEWYFKNKHPVKYWKTYFKNKESYYQRNYSAQGKLLSEGWFLDGKKIKAWIYYISIAPLKTIHKEYFEDGTLKQEWFQENNKPTKYKRIYVKDSKDFYQKNFGNNGNVIAEGWMLKVVEPPRTTTYVKNKTWKFYTKENLDSIGDFKEGNKIKVWKYYDKDNRLKRKVDYQSNKESYTQYDYYDNGNLKTKGAFLNHKKEGYWEFYSKKNILLTSGYYKNGLKNGYWHFFSKSGILIEQGRFEGEKKEKWWSFFDRGGHLLKKCELKKDKLNGFCVYYKDEKIIKGNYFKNGIKIKEWTDWKSFKQDYKDIK